MDNITFEWCVLLLPCVTNVSCLGGLAILVSFQESINNAQCCTIYTCQPPPPPLLLHPYPYTIQKIARLTDDSKMLGYYGIESGMEIGVQVGFGQQELNYYCLCL